MKVNEMAETEATPTIPQCTPSAKDAMLISAVVMENLICSPVRFWVVNTQPVLEKIGATMPPKQTHAKTGAAACHFAPSMRTINGLARITQNSIAGMINMSDRRSMF